MRYPLRFLVIASSVLACNTALCLAQPCLAWRLRSDTGLPARFNHAMAFDSARGVSIISAGADARLDRLDGTWEWDGFDWTLRSVLVPPGQRMDHAMVFDESRAVTVMFGGWWNTIPNGGFYSDETWEWDGFEWVLHQAHGPIQRVVHAMAYDEARNETVLFGGGIEVCTPQCGSIGDTWTFDGVQWTEHAVPGPAPRQAHAMAYDPVRQRVVLFGGVDVGGIWFDDTWEWDGRQWREIPATGPSARFWHTMAYDARRGTVILFGGADENSDALNDTWEWDGVAWQPLRLLSTPPSARSGHTMVYDSVRNVIVLFGGIDQFGQGRVVNAEAWELVSYADCDTSTGVGTLDIFDFLCFQNAFVNADPYACDCDTSTGPGVCDVFDFLCFQSAFVNGCP